MKIEITRAEKKDFSYIKEKLKKYILDDTNAKWQDFLVVRLNEKTIAFGRIIDYKDYYEIASLGVDYCHRKKGIGRKILFALLKKAAKMNPEKPVYCVTHVPDFFRKFNFEEVMPGPQALQRKKRKKCKLDPANSRIMKLNRGL